MGFNQMKKVYLYVFLGFLMCGSAIYASENFSLGQKLQLRAQIERYKIAYKHFPAIREHFDLIIQSNYNFNVVDFLGENLRSKAMRYQINNLIAIADALEIDHYPGYTEEKKQQLEKNDASEDTLFLQLLEKVARAAQAYEPPAPVEMNLDDQNT